MSLGTLVVTFGDTKETEQRAVAAPSLVTIVTGAVEMMEGILMGPSTLTTNDKVFMSATAVDRVAEM